jgi:hypothetical protein
VHRAVRIGEIAGVPCISVVNVVGSLIARSTGLGNPRQAKVNTLIHSALTWYRRVLECWT